MRRKRRKRPGAGSAWLGREGKGSRMQSVSAFHSSAPDAKLHSSNKCLRPKGASRIKTRVLGWMGASCTVCFIIRCRWLAGSNVVCGRKIDFPTNMKIDLPHPLEEGEKRLHVSRFLRG